MPVSHVGLTVSHIPSACSFFLSALQPLGYRYVGGQGNSIGFGTDNDADFFLIPATSGVAKSNAHVAFSATSKTAVRDFYTAALTAGARPNGSPAFRGCDDCIFNAAVVDLDGNSIEVIYHPGDDEQDAYTTVSGGSRVLTWREGIVNVLGDEDRTTFISAPRSKAESVTNTGSMPAITPDSKTSSPGKGLQITGTAIMGTILGAAAGAAVAYAMVKSEQDSAQQEAEFARTMSMKSASGKISPSKISSNTCPPAQAQSREFQPILSSATSFEGKKENESTTRRSRRRVHRNFSTTESVVASRVMEQFDDTDFESTLRPTKTHSAHALVARPQSHQAQSYHSNIHMEARDGRQSEMQLIPSRSKMSTRNPPGSLSTPQLIASTNRQIEYLPASLVQQKPSSTGLKRTISSPPSLCNTNDQIKDTSKQAQEQQTSQDVAAIRRDSAISIYSTHSSKSKTSRHSHRDRSEGNHHHHHHHHHRERRDISPTHSSSRHSHHSTKSKDSSSITSRKSKHEEDSTKHKHKHKHHSNPPTPEKRQSSPSRDSEARYDKASHYYYPLPTSSSSRKTSIVSAKDTPLQISTNTSMVNSAAAAYPLPPSTIAAASSAAMSGIDIALPASRAASSASASLVSAAKKPLPVSRSSSLVSGVSAACKVPLPLSRATSVAVEDDDDDANHCVLSRDGCWPRESSAARQGKNSASAASALTRLVLADKKNSHTRLVVDDDVDTVLPDDSISCISTKTTTSTKSRHSRHKHQ